MFVKYFDYSPCQNVLINIILNKLIMYNFICEPETLILKM